MASLVVLAYAWWVVSLRPFSATATAAVVLSGVVATVAGRGRRRSRRRTVVNPRAGPWAGLASVAVAWEVMAFVQSPRSDHPTLSSLTNAMLDSHPARAAAFALWLVATLELARR